MMLALLIAGVGAILAGLLTIGYGTQIQDSLGNPLVLVGSVSICTGMILLGLCAVVRELKLIARRLGRTEIPGEALARPALEPDALVGSPGALLGSPAGVEEENRGRIMPDPGKIDRVVPRRHEEASRERSRAEARPLPEPFPLDPLPELGPAPLPTPAAESPPRRRSPLFGSRKEREPVQGRTGEGPPLASQRPPSVESPEPSAPPSVGPDDIRPTRERRPSERTRPTYPEPAPAPAASEQQPPNESSEAPPAVTVIKSGVVDGMAYSLYSDGSIEAQMPEGMMRFASIDELRAYLDQKS